jgi:hypothetical protein
MDSADGRRGVIREGFAADASAYLHAMWIHGRDAEPLPLLHGVEVLPGRALNGLPDGWAAALLGARARRERLTAVSAGSWDWVGRQKLRYPGALRAARALVEGSSPDPQSPRGDRPVDTSQRRDAGLSDASLLALADRPEPFTFETILVGEPRSLQIAAHHHLVSLGLRLDLAAFRSWVVSTSTADGA